MAGPKYTADVGMVDVVDVVGVLLAEHDYLGCD